MLFFKLPNLIPGHRFCDLIHLRQEQGVRFNRIFDLKIPLLCFNNIKRTSKENMHTNLLQIQRLTSWDTRKEKLKEYVQTFYCLFFFKISKRV